MGNGQHKAGKLGLLENFARDMDIIRKISRLSGFFGDCFAAAGRNLGMVRVLRRGERMTPGYHASAWFCLPVLKEPFD